MLLQPRPKLIIALAACWILSTLAPTPSIAESPIAPFVTSIVRRYVLWETLEGSEVYSRLTRTSARIGIDNPEMAAARAEIEARLRRIEERFAKERGATVPASALTADEQLWLRSEASRELRLNPKTQDLDFVEPVPPAGFENNRSDFIRAASDPALVADDSDVPLSEKQAAPKRMTRMFDEMKSCVADHPPRTLAKFNFRYLLSQLAIDESMTVMGEVIASGGVDKVEWKNLPADLAFEAMTSIGASRIVGTSGSFAMRWFRLAGFGVAQSSADAVIYYFSPIKETHGASTKNATSARFAYNSAWSQATAPLHVALYDLLAGLDCLYPSKAGGIAVLGVQLGFGLTENVAYFGLRRRVLGDEKSWR